MDIIVKTVLDFIQNKEEYKNSIIAGGAVRDHVLGFQPRDYDIFVPLSKRSLPILISDIKKEFGIEEVENKSKDYETSVGTINNVSNFVFEGKEFDLIAKSFENNEEFGDNVIKEFDYGLNMIYYNGLYIEDNNEKFRYDHNNYSMTLINMSSMYDLPKLMKRYFNFNERNKQNYAFRSECFSLNAKETTLKTRPTNTKSIGLRWMDEAIIAGNRAGLPEPFAERNVPVAGNAHGRVGVQGVLINNQDEDQPVPVVDPRDI